MIFLKLFKYTLSKRYINGFLFTHPKKLVVNLKTIDCFTFIDYILALSQSRNANGFIEDLIKIRYIDENYQFFHRKHFFSD
ncbi:N-acetylmuramoyl-L-alanine amidase-like domain-containing protein [Commensalibacter nepenthis]|uniref:N-acetylmuramoyl-L-alanine amidase-like domain-containing protein n=1 Tax=Commensalibacter nepenthis TaxID=3043872 RepID=UPI0038CFEF9C